MHPRLLLNGFRAIGPDGEQIMVERDPGAGAGPGPLAHRGGEDAVLSAPRTNRHKRVLIGTICALALVATGGGLTAAVAIGADRTPTQEKKIDTATASVERGTLTGSTNASGTLAYGGSREIGAGVGGVVTALPAAGQKVGLGQELFSIDNRATYLFFGPLPAWRELESEMDAGPDVKMFEESLKELGYFHGTVDNEFTWLTRQAILDWQKATDQKRTGSITLGTIVFSAGKVRVAEVTANVGDQAGPGAAMLKVTTLMKLVRVDLKLTDQTLATVGAKVTIALPGGKNITGTVTSVGVPTEKEANGNKEVVVPVVIALDHPAAAGELQQATVTVNFATEKRKNVLSVPVEALLALDANTFGVEVVQKNGKTKRFRVKTGLFAAGRVEVSGDGIAEGQKVVVPKL